MAADGGGAAPWRPGRGLVEPGRDVTSRTTGYENATATYIRREKIASDTYVKHNSTVRNQSTEAQW